MRRTLWLLLVAGCGYPAEDFEADYLDSYCAWAASCAYYDDAEACRTSYEENPDSRPDRTDCVYDDKAGRDCVDAMDERTCPDGEGGGEMPAACNAVYACDGGE